MSAGAPLELTPSEMLAIDSQGTMTQAQARQLLNAEMPGGENGDAQCEVANIFSKYDGVLDFDEFTDLISDLLCLSRDVLQVSPATARAAAQAIAVYGVPGGETATCSLVQFIELAGNWVAVLTDVRVAAQLGGSRPGQSSPPA